MDRSGGGGSQGEDPSHHGGDHLILLECGFYCIGHFLKLALWATIQVQIGDNNQENENNNKQVAGAGF